MTQDEKKPEPPKINIVKTPINLHPLADMKAVPLQGNERRFELSDNAKRRQEAAKLAKKNYVAPGVAFSNLKKERRERARYIEHAGCNYMDRIGRICRKCGKFLTKEMKLAPWHERAERGGK